MSQEDIRNAFINANSPQGYLRIDEGRRFTEADFAAAVQSLPPLPKIKALLLWSRKVGDGCLVALALAAKKNRVFPQLRKLDISSCRVGNKGVNALALAAEANGFPQLRSLRLHCGNVGDKGVESLASAVKAKRFLRLYRLSLQSPLVGDEGAKALADAAEAGGFQQLQDLDLSTTNVGNDGGEALARAAEANGFPRLKLLGLLDTKVNIAVEELKTLDPRRIFQALQGIAVTEAKLVVIGQPSVGKSWLCTRFFLNEDPSKVGETHDIELITPIWKARAKNLDVNLRVWDFGGQHVLHGTHEMFLTQRSIAILVLDVTRTMESNRVEYWQKLSTYCMGPRTPSIIVITQCDRDPSEHKIGSLDPKALQFNLAECPTVIHNFSARAKVSSPQVSQPEPIEALKSTINAALERVEGIGKKISPDVARMKNRVELEMAKRSLVSIQKYQEWCHEERVDDPDRSILRTLDNFGSALFFGLTPFERRQNRDRELLTALPPSQQRLRTAPRDSVLDEWIANPRWLNWTIYEVARQSENAQRIPSGQMTREEITAFANQAAMDKGLKMPPNGPTYICGVLKLTELCWELEKDVFLFPRGLPMEMPYGCETWRKEDPWEWEFLPEQMFHRFVVRMHERGQVVKNSMGAWQHWRNAVVVEQPSKCRAVIIAKPEDGRLEARLDPDSNDTNSFGQLCNYVGDLFVSEFVKQAPTRKQLPTEIRKEKPSSDFEFAPIRIIRAAIGDVCGECIPSSSCVSRWNVRDNKKKGQARQIHIQDALDCYATYYKNYYRRKELRELTDAERKRRKREVKGPDLDPKDRKLILAAISWHMREDM